MTGAFLRHTGGLAAVEFGMIAPMIVLLFFGMLEASDALSVKRKVGNAANALVDLVGQSTEITPGELQDIFTGVQKIIDPNLTSPVTISVASIIRDPDDTDNIIVHWSRDKNLAEPYARGEAYAKLDNEAVLKANMSVLVVELTYEYHSQISRRIYGPPVLLTKVATRLPRRSAQVRFCPDANPDNCY